MESQDFTPISEAQKFVAYGLLKQWTIEKTPLADTYQIYLGQQFGYINSQREKTTARQFKTVDAALATVEACGFSIDVIRGA